MTYLAAPKYMQKNKYKVLIFIALTCFTACNGPQNISEIKTDTKFKSISTQSDSCLKVLSYKHPLAYFFDGGYSEMAFKIVADSLDKMSNQRRVVCAQIFIDYGHFEKGLQLIENINDSNVNFEILHIQMLASLNKLDTNASRKMRIGLAQELQRKPSIEHQFDFDALNAYYYHNCGNYLAAIKLNLDLLKRIKGTVYEDKFERKIYRRLGNSYNDIVRINIPFKESREICFKKTLRYYAKEKEILDRQKPSNEIRKGLNLITTAMLLNEDKKTNIIPYYIGALGHLIQYKDKDFILSRNNIYTSIAITQMAGIGLKRKNEINSRQIDSLIDLNKSLMEQQTILSLNSNEGLDLKEYYTQICQEMKLVLYCQDKSKLPNSLELLNQSNSSKYPNTNWLNALKSTFGESYKDAGKTWRILNEMRVLAIKENDTKLLVFSEKQLDFFNPKINQVLKANKPLLLDKIWLEQTIDKCKKEDRCIIDYQFLFNNETILIKIDKTGIQTIFIKPSERISEQEINALVHLMHTDSIAAYETLACSIARRLGLTTISSKNISICTDEYLEKIPFDALVIKTHGAKKWNELAYLGEEKNISLLPNLNCTGKQTEEILDSKINVWYSDSDNQTLPFNGQLIKFFQDKFSCETNNKALNKNGIHHIMSHTHNNKTGGIQFELNDAKINLSSEGLGCMLSVLHGCKSGEGKVIKSEGSLSLVRMFFYNGAKSVIFSNWEADNASSTFMFENFYDLLQKGESTHKALALAKGSIRKHPQFSEWANPFYWANFQVSGNDLRLGQ